MEQRLDARLTELPPAALHELVGRISGIDEFRGWWQGRAHAFPSLLARLRERTIEVSAGISARNACARSPFPPRGRPWGRRTERGMFAGEAAMRSGYADLLRAVFHGHADMEFGRDLVLEFHARLFRHSPADRAHRGRYRGIPGGAAAYPIGGRESPGLRPAEPHLAPVKMDLLVRWTSSRLASRGFHPLLVVASFLLEFLAVSPFADGNRRMSRILATLLLLRCGYDHVPHFPLDAVIAERETEYAIALRRAQAKRNLPRPDIMPWLSAFLDVLQEQARGLGALLEGCPREDLLSGNQRAVLSLLDRHGEVTVRLACRELGIPRDTAKQVLARLCERNAVRRTGAGRAARYLRPPPG